MNPLLKALGAGSILQAIMVVVGHFAPNLQTAGLFPIAGTLIGVLTGWLAGKGTSGTGGGGGIPAGIVKLAANGGIAGAGAGVIGSLISTALGDVPVSNAAIAGGSTLVAGALGGILTRFLGRKVA